MLRRTWTTVGVVAIFAVVLAFGQKENRIRVMLFGQPCTLQGLIPEEKLKQIHAVSPAQIPPFQTEQLVRQAMSKVRSSKSLPPEMKDYLEQLTKHLDANLAFFNGVHAARASLKSSDFFQITRPHLSSKPTRRLQRQVARIAKKVVRPDDIDQLYETYLELVIHRPEAEFHRAIRRMNVHYSCTFEAGEATESESEN